MKLLKYILIILTTGLFLCLPISASLHIIENTAADPSGTFGDNLTWTLSEDGVLTVSGVGPMADQVEPGALWQTLSHKDVVRIEIEAGVTSIGKFAFACFPSLKSVSMADTVTAVGDEAFRASSLEEITLSPNLTSIGYNAFDNCAKLQSIILPDGLTEIKTSAFFACSALKEITFPQNLKLIEKYAFYGCRSLRVVWLPMGLEIIEESAFSDCTALRQLLFPSSVQTVGDYAFTGCTNLTSISINADSLVIGKYAFRQCKNLTQIFLGYGITEIGSNAFLDCTSLQTVVLPSSLQRISNGLFDNCTSLERIVIPHGVKSVSSFAFRNCTSLTQVSISDTVTHIYNQAFEGCTALESILLPDSVVHLSMAVFSGCDSLKTVSVYSKEDMYICQNSDWGPFFAGAPKDVLYRCYEGSTLHTYAMEHNLNYEFLTDWDTVFSDISSDDAAYSAICHMADRGIFVGTSDDTFSPDMLLTRAMFVTLLGRMAGIDAAAYTEQVFVDVPMDAWYAPYAAWAADEGIVIGVGDHHFGRDMLIDIQQAVTMLARYSGFPWDIDNSGQSAYDFPDSTEEMTYWSDSGIFWAVSIGLYEGKNGLLDLYTPLTRADTALLFSRFCQLILGA